MQEKLKMVPLFAGLPDDDLRDLSRAITTLRLKKGEMLFEEGDKDVTAYIIDSGEIEILKTEKRKEYQERKWTWWMKIMTTVAQENLRKINEAGGILVAGTDQTIGPALHRELELMADAGIPLSDIIRIATLNGAIFLGKERELGSIEEGKIADLVLLAADPTKDINNTKQIVQVIKGGQLVDRSKLNLPINE